MTREPPCRGLEVGVRTAALELINQIVVGVGEADRNSLAVQTEALKCAVRITKETVDSSALQARLAAAAVLR